MKKYRHGFTLTEVLITLVIIGIIAAMTIPTLMNKTNEQETVVALKKAYSVLGQAYQRVVAENGEIYLQNLGATREESTKVLGDMFAKQLSVQKNCGMATDEDCFSTQNDGMYTLFDGTDWHEFNSHSPQYKLRLNDGTSLGIEVFGAYEERGTSVSLKQVLGTFLVDINGSKGPSTLGKDVFIFDITKYGVVPYGTPDDTQSPLTSCRSSGGSCTAWVITKGNMDYLRKDVSW